MKTLKFAYLSIENPENKRVWSGTHYSILRSLKTIGNVDILGPYEPKATLFISKVINQISLLLFKKRISYRHSTFLSKAYANYFNEKLKNKNYDYIIAPAASAEIAFLETDLPIIYITDGTFKSCLNYHKSLSNLTKKSIEAGNLIEQQAINKSRYVIVSSEWAAESVINDYQTSKEKIKIIPFGANFESLPSEQELVFETPVEWKILFVAVYWQSKGGDIVFNTFNFLREKGYNVSLTILGCIPPSEVKDEKITVIPFIDKNSSEGQQQLFEIYRAHHILILPTRFDCSPIVINEASAFGIPSIVSDTGGIKGHLTNAQNGFVVDYTDKGDKYADIIGDLISDPMKYLALRQTTRKAYVERLNWHHWIKEIQKALEQL